MFAANNWRTTMRSSYLLPLIGLISLLNLTEARAVQVGEQAPCVELNNIARDGTESEHCIRDPKREGQFKILEFFSTTCTDCAKNLPIISNLARELENKATTRLVSIDRN